jgi:polyisoprenoid-binding protein YceI
MSQVKVTIHTNNMATGIPKLDEHLKSDSFFDVAKYPTATFVSDKIEVTGKNTGKIYGTLTLHGVSKPVVLDATMLKIGMHPMKNVKSVGFTATTTLKRSDFGMNAYLPNLGDEVQIDIGAEANLAS